MAIVSSIACGLMPAWQSLKESISAGMHRERKLRIRQALVIAQIAVSFIVLTTAALFLQNLVRASSLGPGFDVHNGPRRGQLPPGIYQSAGQSIRTSPARWRGFAQFRASKARLPREYSFTDNTNYGSELTFAGNGEKQDARFNWNAVTRLLPRHGHPLAQRPRLRGSRRRRIEGGYRQ